ncbi:MAG: large conductance mechanosensitive channel protein MscL [Clostridiales bacterium]|nr:large conductance mechanosensitive channel protein MscL [Clostridiales bacterium]
MKKKKTGFFQEFKAFISRGNIVDMAVGVIIGGAFSAIVTALTNKIIKPFIDWIVMLATGGKSLGLYTFMKKVMVDTVDEAGKVTQSIDFTNSIYIDWGAFIMAIIDFLLIALVLFIIVKVLMSFQKMRDEFNNADRKEVNARAKAIKKERGISKQEALEVVKAQIEEEKAAAEAAAAANAAPAAPTTEELLAQIRDLLAAQNGGKTDKKAE